MLNWEMAESRMEIPGTTAAEIAKDDGYEIVAMTHESDYGLILMFAETEIGQVEILRKVVPPVSDMKFLMFVLSEGLEPPAVVMENPETPVLPQIEYVRSFAEQLYENRLDKAVVKTAVEELVASVKDGTYQPPSEEEEPEDAEAVG